jgi:hypothetical protein
VELSATEKQQQPQSIPMEHGAKQSCHACHEDFKTAWDEDCEEWILKDAIRAENKLYHRQCYAELTAEPSAAGTKSTVLGKRTARD